MRYAASSQEQEQIQEQSQEQEQEQLLSQVQEQSHQQILAARIVEAPAAGLAPAWPAENRIFPATCWRSDFDGSPA